MRLHRDPKTSPLARGRLLLHSGTDGTGAQIAHLRRPGPSPQRVLLVADARLAVAPQGRWSTHFAGALLERWWLLDRRGIDLDVLQGAWSSLNRIDASSVGHFLRRYDAVVVLTDPDLDARDSRHSLDPDTAQAVLRAIPSTTGVAVVIARDAGSDAPFAHGSEPHALARLATHVMSPQDPCAASSLAEDLHRERIIARGDVVPKPARSPVPTHLQHVAAYARNAFGVDQATVDLVRGGRLRSVVSVGLDLGPAMLPVSLSRLTAERGHLLLIPDVARQRPIGAPGRIGFYAGQPLRAVDGSLTGTLNLYDREARAGESFDASAMHDFVLLAAAESEADEAVGGPGDRR